MFQTSYLISHPLTYSRDSTRAKIGIISGTFFAFFLQFPITVCHFFYLKPSNIIEKWGQDYWDLYGDNVFLYMNKYKECVRFYWPGTFDQYMIVYFVLSMNLIAVFLMVLSFAIIISVVLKSRQALGVTRQSFHEHERKRKQQKRQNFKIGLRSISLTFCTALPWFPNLVMSVILTIEPVDTNFWYILTEITNNLYYIVPWLFPFLAIVTNPAIYRETVGLVRPTRVEQSRTANTRCWYRRKVTLEPGHALNLLKITLCFSAESSFENGRMFRLPFMWLILCYHLPLNQTYFRAIIFTIYCCIKNV